MSPINDQFLNDIREQLQKIPPAEWVGEMLSEYYRTGTYRPADLHRVLGDQNRGVEISDRLGVDSHFVQD